MEYKQIYPYPDTPNMISKWINIYRTRNNISGKLVEKVGGITNFSFLDSYVNRPVFGSPEKRIYQEFTIRHSATEEPYVRKRWSVVRSAKNKKYILDDYFATRVISYYCYLKHISYINWKRKTKTEYTNTKDIIGILIEIKKEIRNKNPRAFDKFNVPKVSINYLNRLIHYLQKEFDLEFPIPIHSSTKRIYISDKLKIREKIIREKLDIEFGHKPEK